MRIMPKYYRWNAYNMSMFFFIKGQLMLFPTMTLDQAISNYYKFTDIDEGEWDRMAIRTQYCRMQQEFYNDLKNECTKANQRPVRPEAGADKS